MSKPTLRHYFDIGERTLVQGDGWDEGTYQFQERYPIEHVAGMAVFMENTSDDTAVVRIDESDNGTTWTPVTFSTHTLAGQLMVTMVSQSRTAILFTSTSEYLRVRALDADGEAIRSGVYCYAIEYPPETARSEIY